LLLLIEVLAALAVVAGIYYLSHRAPGTAQPQPAAGGAGQQGPSSPASTTAPQAPAVTVVSTSAVAAASAAQAAAADRRMGELAKAMSENYRKLGELRRIAQETPEVKQLQASIEADRGALDELMQADPPIKAMSARRKTLLDEMTALQVKQSELARQARANPTNAAVKAEGQAAMAKIRQTSSELGTVTRQLEEARRNYAGQNPAAAEIAARLAAGQEKIRTAVTANPEIQAIEQQIQTLAAESRQLSRSRARRTLPAATPRPRPVVPQVPAAPLPAPVGSESGEPSVEKNAP
jgi:hypothetical protein